MASRWAWKKFAYERVFRLLARRVVRRADRRPRALRCRHGTRGGKLSKEWDAMFARYKAQYPDSGADIEQMNKRELPTGWEKSLPTFPASASGMSTRDASGKVLNAMAQKVNWLMGGAADLVSQYQDAAGVRVCRRLPGPGRTRQLQGPQLPLRHSRARHVRHREWHGAHRICAHSARAS